MPRCLACYPTLVRVPIAPTILKFLRNWVQVGAVVVGFDRHINYHKIQYATLCISENPGCHFIATNLDAKTHLTDAQEWAGNGSMVGAIKGGLSGSTHQ